MPFILVPAAATDWDFAWSIQREAFLDLVNQTSGVDRGLGTAVMRQLMDEAHSRSVPRRLSVYRSNTARRLYARLGFLETPRDELWVFMEAR